MITWNHQLELMEILDVLQCRGQAALDMDMFMAYFAASDQVTNQTRTWEIDWVSPEKENTLGSITKRTWALSFPKSVAG